jgi:AcrR family transcriptional regulator
MPRDPFEKRPVVSRRGGAVKPPLSRDLVVDTALDLLGRDGLEGMSLRKVAAALKTGPASLYVYVKDLQELETLVLDRALGRLKTGVARHEPWRERLSALLGAYARLLIGNPGLAQLAMRTIAAGPHALRLLEALLEVLEQGGVERQTAAWAVDLLLLYSTAIAAEQSQRRQQPDPMGTIASVIGEVSESEYPRIHRAREVLLSGAGEERFAWALDVLIEGVLQASKRASKHAPEQSLARGDEDGEP